MHSPVLEATSPIALDIEGDNESELNPNAPAFVPSWKPTLPRAQSSHASTSSAAFNHNEGGQWVTHGTYNYQWAARGEDYWLDETIGYCLDHEDVMRAHLYKPPQKPKGKTHGRARGAQLHMSNAQYNARWVHA